jgi:putative Mn2+ efflux pump MntP
MTALLLIAFSLSLDAFAVSVSSGIAIPNLKFYHAARASFFFGLFQFVMPLAGWYLGSLAAGSTTFIEAYDHWIAFGLLAFIGGKMLVEALRRKGVEREKEGGERSGAADASAGTSNGTGQENSQVEKTGDIRSLKTLFVLAVATSIDALAAGISLNIMGHGVWQSAAIIGGVTFAVCLCGFEFGRRIGLALEKWAQAAGGLALIGIGVKILAEHLLGGG